MFPARVGRNQRLTPILSRCFGATGLTCEKPLPPRRVISEDDITENFLKGSGPGGQKINKTSSAVQLKHLPTGIVVKSQGTRSREQNRKHARKLLSEKLEELEKGDQSRTALKAERARTKKASADKKSRRKYRLLAEEKAKGREEGATMGEAGPLEESEASLDSTKEEAVNRRQEVDEKP